MYITELTKQELRFRKSLSWGIVHYKTKDGEYTYDVDTKDVYYKGNNRMFREYCGTINL